jgi:hypothetical protein
MPKLSDLNVGNSKQVNIAWTKWLLDLHTTNSMWLENMTDPKPCNNDICTPDTAACHITYDSICLAQWMKQYDEERLKNISALGSSKLKVNHVKVLWKLHQQSLCWAGLYGQVLKKSNFSIILRWDTLCRISMTSLCIHGSLWSTYGESARKRKQ